MHISKLILNLRLGDRRGMRRKKVLVMCKTKQKSKQKETKTKEIPKSNPQTTVINQSVSVAAMLFKLLVISFFYMMNIAQF